MEVFSWPLGLTHVPTLLDTSSKSDVHWIKFETMCVAITLLILWNRKNYQAQLPKKHIKSHWSKLSWIGPICGQKMKRKDVYLLWQAGIKFLFFPNMKNHSPFLLYFSPYCNCCVFRPAFGCCAHPKAGRNLFSAIFNLFCSF